MDLLGGSEYLGPTRVSLQLLLCTDTAALSSIELNYKAHHFSVRTGGHRARGIGVLRKTVFLLVSFTGNAISLSPSFFFFFCFFLFLFLSLLSLSGALSCNMSCNYKSSRSRCTAHSFIAGPALGRLFSLFFIFALGRLFYLFFIFALVPACPCPRTCLMCV